MSLKINRPLHVDSWSKSAV